MKVFGNIIAWPGALIVALSIVLAFSSGGYNFDLYEMGLDFAMMVAFFGLLLHCRGFDRGDRTIIAHLLEVKQGDRICLKKGC